MRKYIMTGAYYDRMNYSHPTPITQHNISYDIQQVYQQIMSDDGTGIAFSRRISFPNADIADFFGQEEDSYIDYYTYWLHDGQPWAKLIQRIVDLHSVKKLKK